MSTATARAYQPYFAGRFMPFEMRKSPQNKAFCGLVPCVQDSNETIHHGKITKRGPQELRTSFVQLVLGIRRCKDTSDWRMMQRYEYMKKNKGSGKSIVAAARKMAEIIWAMLSDKQDFDSDRMKGVYRPITLADKVLSTMN